MKVGKEDLIGILAAVEWYLRQDHEALAARYEAMVEHLVDWGRGRPDVDVAREAHGEAGQPTPRALIRLLPPIAASPRRDPCRRCGHSRPASSSSRQVTIVLPRARKRSFQARRGLVTRRAQRQVLEGEWWR